MEFRACRHLAAGHVDVVLSNIVSTALAVQQGLKIRIIAPANLTGVQPPDTAGMVVKTESPIRSALDLVGKRVAVNTRNNINWLYARAWIDQVGGDLSGVIFLEVPFPQMIDAVVGGSVDAAFVVEPFLGNGIDSKKVRLLGWPYNQVQKYIPVSQYVATAKFIDAKQDLVAAFYFGLPARRRMDECQSGKKRVGRRDRELHPNGIRNDHAPKCSQVSRVS